MKILLLEYITAGGLNGLPLPASLLREGTLMRDALLHDFSMLDDVQIVTTYDTRVSFPVQSQEAVGITKAASPIKIWQEMLQSCDLALVIAPETDGVLTELTQMLEVSAVKNLGCNQQAVDIASSKYATYHVLKSANILTIPTYTPNEWMTSNFESEVSFSDGYVLKPNDGAGCGDTFYFSDKAALHAWLNLHPAKQAGYIIQPYQAGMPASISILCKAGKAWVLACNQQMIKLQASNTQTTQLSQAATIHYNGCLVNGIDKYHAAFAKLADSVVKALAGLNGYVGIDVIVDDDAIYVVEINPRITTSYIGLHESLNYNPAQLMLDLIDNPTFKLPANLAAKMIDINLDE